MKTPKQSTAVDVAVIEERATEVDRLAHALWLTGARLSFMNNPLSFFLTDSKLKTERQLYRRIARRAFQWPDEPTCLMCSCTEMNACEGGCSWLFMSKDNNWGVCSACFETLANADEQL